MSGAPPDDDTRPLPYGWVKQWNSDYAQHFYVDTKADPPRSIWVHPLDDEQYLKGHPEAREKSPSPYRPPAGPPPPGASSSAASTSSSRGDELRNRMERDKDKGGEKRGFLGKIKDSVIGTKEERELAKLREREERQRQQELRRRQREEIQRRQQEYYRQQQQQQQQQQQFGPPQGYYGGAPAQQGGYYAPQYAPQQQQRRGGFGGLGGGGIGVPLLGGLAGGLLLGEALDGFGGDDGGFGGDDGGGGFDGGGDF